MAPQSPTDDRQGHLGPGSVGAVLIDIDNIAGSQVLDGHGGVDIIAVGGAVGSGLGELDELHIGSRSGLLGSFSLEGSAHTTNSQNNNLEYWEH